MTAYVNNSSHRSGARADNLSIQEFSRELKYGIGADIIAKIDNPLGAALVVIEEHPQHLQSMLLARILSALTFGVGQFRRAEVFGLDRGTRALAVALANARAADGVVVELWEKAVDAAGAAQLGVTRAVAAAVSQESGDAKI